MFIDRKKLEDHGYTVDVATDEDDVFLGVHINGLNHERYQETLKAFSSALRVDFPNVDRDVLTGIAHRALNEAQGHDVIRICAQS